MKTFDEYLAEARGDITVYHGDNYNTRSLEPRLMNNGNNQEGIGIYFTDRYETTKAYGSNVVEVDISMTKFVESRKPVSVLGRSGVLNVLHDMARSDRESMFYLVSDYGVFLQEPEELESYHVDDLYQLMRDEQIRNFQITMANSFGVEKFVRSWVKHIRVDGTWSRQNGGERWFAIINPKIKVSRAIDPS